MKIAQVSPLFESVPPKTYGGTERVVSYLTEQLIEMGHEVTLFASGDSVTSAKLVPCAPRALRLDPESKLPLASHFMALEKVYAIADEFDVIHFHTDHLHFPVVRRLPCKHVTTLHGRLDLPELKPLFREFSEVPLISISDSQRLPVESANWLATIHHGLPLDAFAFHRMPSPDEYFLFLGRISPEKRPDLAIEIARKAGVPIKIAAKVDPVDQPYFKAVVAPKLSQPGVEYLGEVGGKQKNDLLGGARALLFPIDWPEPFGLVMIEAMACGTPVIAFRNGSVTEVVDPGVTGFIVESVEEAVTATRSVDEIDRRGCRARFERRFSAKRMANDYLAAFQAVSFEPSFLETSTA